MNLEIAKNGSRNSAFLWHTALLWGGGGGGRRRRGGGGRRRRRRVHRKIQQTYMIQQFSFWKKYQMVKIKWTYKVYGGPPSNMIHLRHLMLKTNGDDQNSKRQRI